MIPTVPEDVQSYLDAVRAELHDLPPDERDDLLADVESALIESANDDEAPMASRLGPPEMFAAELRTAAGMESQHAATSGGRDSALVRLAKAVQRLDADPRVARAHSTVRELAPVWWIARAYVVIAAIALATGAPWSLEHPAFPTWHLGRAGVLVLALAVLGSCWLGLRTRESAEHVRGGLVLLNVVLLLAAIPVVRHLDRPSPLAREVQALNFQIATATPNTPGGLVVDGRPVANIYPYTRDGRLLLDVLLYDDNGAPINLRPNSLDPDRRLLVTKAGTPVYNSFPVRYYEPGTNRVADPAAGPRHSAPDIVTPPVQRVPVKRVVTPPTKTTR
jgi:hypothetical protein